MSQFTSKVNTLHLVPFVFALATIPGCASPIFVPGGYELLNSPSVSLHTLYGLPATYNSTSLPLGSYDFGTGAGPINTGSANFLLTRLNSFTLPTIGSTASVPILHLAFNNRTDQIVPYSGFSLGATGSGHVTASESPNYTPLGLETITRTSDIGGTFTLTYKNEIAFYAEGGTLLSTSPVLTVTSLNGTWQTTPSAGELVIPGVNDYGFFITNVTLQNSLGNMQTLSPALATPEPTTFALLGGVFVGGVLIRKRCKLN